MGKILSTENGEPKAVSVELDAKTTGHVLIQFNEKDGFSVRMDGTLPADRLYFELQMIQESLMAMTMQARAQKMMREQASSVQVAGAKTPWG